MAVNRGGRPRKSESEKLRRTRIGIYVSSELSERLEVFRASQPVRPALSSVIFVALDRFLKEQGF